IGQNALTGPWLSPLVFREGPDGERMNFIAHQAAQAVINQLVPRERALSGELIGNDYGLEMSVVVTRDIDSRIPQAGCDERFDFFRLHSPYQGTFSRAQGFSEARRRPRACSVTKRPFGTVSWPVPVAASSETSATGPWITHLRLVSRKSLLDSGCLGQVTAPTLDNSRLKACEVTSEHHAG